MLDSQAKIISAEPGSAEFDQRMASLARPLVFTNGCFDLLHRGHVDYLQRARNLGEALIVAVNSDESVRKQQKGADRPLNKLADRMALLASLEAVDAVLGFDSDTPLELIEIIKPDHLVKGGDWPVPEIVGAAEVLAWGGEVHSLTFTYQRSTSELIERIRN